VEFAAESTVASGSRSHLVTTSTRSAPELVIDAILDVLTP